MLLQINLQTSFGGKVSIESMPVNFMSMKYHISSASTQLHFEALFIQSEFSYLRLVP
jgi:hypothetical protein